MKTRKAFLFLAVLIFAGRISAPVHAGGIVDRVFNGGAKNLAKQTMELAKYAADIASGDNSGATAPLPVAATRMPSPTPALSTPAPATTPTRSTTTPASGNLDTWTAVVNSTFGTDHINGIAWGNNRFVAVGDDGRMAYADW